MTDIAPMYNDRSFIEKQLMSNNRILFVDDNHVVQFLLQFNIDRLGLNHRLVLARDGSAAMTEVEKQPFAVIITDYNMPGMNGLDLAQRVRRDFPEIEIIIATLSDIPTIQREAQQREVMIDGYLDKTLMLRQLKEFVTLVQL